MSGHIGIFLVISSYLLPLVVGLCLVLRHQSTYPSHLLLIYLSITLCVEITGVALALKGINNLWLYRVYLYVELTFPFILFYNQFSKRSTRTTLIVFYVLAFVFTSVLNCYEDWDEHATLQTIISFSFIGFIIIRYFIEMFQQELVINPFREIHFLVGSMIFLAQSCTFIHNVVYNHLVQGYFGDEIQYLFSDINFYLIFIYNIIYTIALWTSRRILT